MMRGEKKGGQLIYATRFMIHCPILKIAGTISQPSRWWQMPLTTSFGIASAKLRQVFELCKSLTNAVELSPKNVNKNA